MQRIAPESPSQNSFPEQREDDFYGRMANMVLLFHTFLQLHCSTMQTQEDLEGSVLLFSKNWSLVFKSPQITRINAFNCVEILDKKINVMSDI